MLVINVTMKRLTLTFYNEQILKKTTDSKIVTNTNATYFIQLDIDFCFVHLTAFSSSTYKETFYFQRFCEGCDCRVLGQMFTGFCVYKSLFPCKNMRKK